MTLYDACATVEGFDGEEHTKEEIIKAWQFIIDTKAYKGLQGWYGRTCADLIARGICHA